MKRTMACISVISICVAGAFATRILNNADFSDVEADTRRPAHWNVPDNGLWAMVENGGPEGGACLRYRAEKKTRSGAVTQQCRYIEPAKMYTLTAQVKSAGGLRPVIEVIDRLTGETIASVVAASAPSWHSAQLQFEPKNADVIVRLYGDVGHLEHGPPRAGSAGFADLSLQAHENNAEGMSQQATNIALGRSCEMSKPNYRLCTDDADDIQLTDGEYTEGYFWTQASTVGWSGRKPRQVTIDLGKDRPIGGISVNSAAGVANVHWPKRIILFASPAGEQWYRVGELIEMHTKRQPLPEYGEYTVQRIWTDQLRTHGRYLQLWIEPTETYTFIDEIEVFRGDDAFLKAEYSQPPIDNVMRYMDQVLTTDLIRRQFRRDLAAVRDDIGRLPQARKQKLSKRAEALEAAIDGMEPPFMKGFRAVLPMTDLETKIFRLQAAVWRAQGKPNLRLWKNHRWDPLPPAAEPRDKQQPVLEVRMMNNEHRADVLNLTNAGPKPLQCRLHITGIEPLQPPEDVSVHEVLTVGTRRFVAVSAALPKARKTGREFVVNVPAGMTRQIWLSFNPDGWKPGDYEGHIRVQCAEMQMQSVPLKMHIYPMRFPDRTALHLGGWTYTNSENMYGVTPQNHDALVATLKRHHVNAPWATSGTMPPGDYDADGNMTQKPDTESFDAFVELWPDAKKYMVFKHVGRSFAGSKIRTGLFRKKVSGWAQFWGRHVRKLGLDAGQTGLLLVDEPHSAEQYETTIAWAKAIRSGEPAIDIFCDPQPKNKKGPLEMFEHIDILCPFRRPFLSRPDWYRDMFYRFRDRGTELWFYDASGPARTFDPYTFYLLQEWLCFDRGATGSAFWAFGDPGGVSCGNEYPAEGNGPYTPLYIDDETVTDAKYMEAIREGVQDYQYLVMLRSRIEKLEGAGADEGTLQHAREVLHGATDRVLKPDVITKYRWDVPKDRTVVDAVRTDILEALADLQDLQ